MALRKNTGSDLAPELQEILDKNGMQAHLVDNGGSMQLVVQGHDSPMKTYPVSDRQLQKLTDWGTNSANKGAYNTFTDIIANDFYMPKNFVHARNAGGRVAMGLHGYRVGAGEAGRPHAVGAPVPLRDDRPGFAPREQPGFHMRRVGGRLFMQEPPMVPERQNGYMKPGELQSGAYGFYYKGNVQQGTQQVDALQNVPVVQPVQQVHDEPAKKYRDLISSAVYFTNDKWQECLSSHGINIDAQNKILYMTNFGTHYDLTDEQVKELTNNSLKGDGVPHRIDVINGIIGKDFQDKLTFDMLNSTEQPSLHLTPEKQQELNAQRMPTEQAVIENQPLQQEQHPDGVNGHDLDDTDKGWYREGSHGRSVDVGDIWVEKMQTQEGQDNKYRMSAVINGETITHEISQKQYDKFMAVDDYHRMKLFSRVFPEVDMKTVPGQGKNIGPAILAGLTAIGGVAAAVGSQHHGDDMAPDIYMEHHARGHVYMKPGVDTPQEIAARAFEAGVHASEHHGGGLAR